MMKRSDQLSLTTSLSKTLSIRTASFSLAALVMIAFGVVEFAGLNRVQAAHAPDFRELGFNSKAEMRNYLTISSAQITEVKTDPAIRSELTEVIGVITSGPTPVQVTVSDGGTPAAQSPVGTAPRVGLPGLPITPAPGPIATAPTTPPLPGVVPAHPPIVLSPGAIPGLGSGGISLDPASIMPWIELGEKIWQMIAANKPVANVSTARAFVLPVAQQDWTQMENWKGPATHTYKLDYKNLYGATVISHTYTLAFNYGGTYNDAGQFLANVTMIPSNVTVAWGYTLNTTVEVGTAVNTASKVSPVPGLELDLVTKVDTVLKHNETHDAFYVRGDGTYSQLNGGDTATEIPAK